jgi:hypothetical protein
MPRAITVALVFFVAMNAFAGAFMATGAADTLGLDAPTGEQDEYEQYDEEQNVTGGTGQGDTLADFRNAATSQLAGIFGAIFPGLRMLHRAGVPDYIIGILGSVFGVMFVVASLSFLRGVNL